MSMVSAPSDRRFKRARVKPARRRSLWRRLVWPLALRLALAVAAGFAAYAAYSVVARADVLQVTDIVVKGNRRLTPDDVASWLADLRGEHLLWSNLDAWRERLLALPWVRDATLRRSLPSTIEVLLSEREPIGIARIDGRLYLVDESGKVIDEYDAQYSGFDVPIIDGIAGSGTEGAADPVRAALAGRVMASLRPAHQVSERISQLDVSDVHNVSIILNGDPAVIHLGAERFLERLQGYLELAETVRERVPEIDYVDLRFDDRIYVRPAGRLDGPRPVTLAASRLTPGGAHGARAQGRH